MKKSTTQLTTQQTQIIDAIKQGDISEVYNLASQEIDLNFHDENLDTVFSIAAHYGQMTILNFLTLNMQKNTNRYINLPSRK